MKARITFIFFLLLFFSPKLYAQRPEHLYDSALVCKLKIKSIAISESGKTVQRFLFDSNCHLIQDSTEASINVFNYDNLGRLKRRIIGNWIDERFNYDNDTVKTYMRADSNGNYITKETNYKKLHKKVISEQKLNTKQFYDSAIYYYDAHEKLLEKRKVSPGFFLTKKYFYDSLGRLSKVTSWSNDFTNSLHYSYTTSNGNSIVSEKLFGANGEFIKLVSEKIYDSSKRLMEYKNQYFETYFYEYDSLNRVSKSDKIGSKSGSKTSKLYSYNTDGTIHKIEILFFRKETLIEKYFQEFAYSY